MIKNNYKDDVFSGNRKYRLVNNSDGTVSLEDVTSYTVTGSTFGANDLNAIATAVNTHDSTITNHTSTIASHTTSINSHTSSIRDNKTKIDSHTNTLSSHSSSISTHTSGIRENKTNIANVKEKTPRVYTGVRVNSWERLSSIPNYPYRGDIVLADAKSTDVPFVNFRIPFPEGLSSACEAVNGHVYIYAEKQVSVEIDSVMLVKGR